MFGGFLPAVSSVGKNREHVTLSGIVSRGVEETFKGSVSSGSVTSVDNSHDSILNTCIQIVVGLVRIVFDNPIVNGIRNIFAGLDKSSEIGNRDNTANQIDKGQLISQEQEQGQPVENPDAPLPLDLGDPWWSTSWLYRKEITIDRTKVAGPLTNFPVLINITDNDLKVKAQSNGNDIVFTNKTGTKLNHEIELYTSSSGHLVAWVNVTSLSSTVDTVLYVYYGNLTCGSQANKVGVWRSGYRMVQHLKETSGTHIDSTSYGNDGVPHGVTQNAVGKVDGADSFDGVNDYVGVADADSLDFGTGDFTIEAWIKTSYVPPASWARIICKSSGSDGYIFYIRGSDGALRFMRTLSYDSPDTPVNVVNGVWHHVVIVADGSNGHFYVDGALDGTKSFGTGNVNTLSNLAMGSKSDGVDTFFTGLMDEVRISSVARGASWISTEYNNQYDPNGFLSIGGEEVGEIHEKPVLSDENPMNGSTDVNLTPALSIHVIDLQGDKMDVYFRTNASGTWKTIGTNMSVDNGTYYCSNTSNMNSCNTEYWWSVNTTDPLPLGSGNWTNQTYSFTTGMELTVVLISPGNKTILDANDVLFKCHVIDDTGIKNISLYTNISGSWEHVETINATTGGEYSHDPSMQLWMHLNNDSSYGENETHVYDFSGLGRNGTVAGDTIYTSDGKFGGAFMFDGDEDIIRLKNSTYGLPGMSGATIAAWVKPTSGQTDVQGAVVYIDRGVTFSTRLLLGVNNDQTVHVKCRSATETSFQIITTTEAIPIDKWSHITGVVNLSSGKMQVYINGTLSKEETKSFAQSTFADTTTIESGIGGIPGGTTTDYDYKGLVDEVAVYNRALSPEAISDLFSSEGHPTSLNVTFTVNNIPEGTYHWNCLAYDIENNSAWAANNYTFTIAPPTWAYYKKITINHTKVAANLSNFPVLISINSDADLASHAQPDGDDLVFKDYNDIILNHEIEFYNPSNGNLIVWVNVTSLSSTEDTILYMYYGNPSVTSQQNPSGVWGSHYKMVQHLNETSGTHYDSTSYGNDGTPHGVTQNAVGKIDGADSFDGVNDYVGVADDDSLDFGTGDFTIEAWINTSSVPVSWARIVCKQTSTSNGYAFYLNGSSGGIRFNRAGSFGSPDTPVNVVNGVWHHVAIVLDGSDGHFYVDGVLDGTKTFGTNNVDTGSSLALGSGSDGSDCFFDDMMDEVRISSVARNISWISTEYNNQYDPDTFYMIGIEETGAILKQYTLPVKEYWNLISIPFNETKAKTTIKVRNNSIEYTWDDAVSNHIVLDNFYDWDTTGYVISDSLVPGQGYWMWAYYDCVMILTSSKTEDARLSDLQIGWNIIGLPVNTSLAKSTLIVNYSGNNYTWEQATTGADPIILGFIYAWHRSNQMYMLSDTFVPGNSYWMYAYKDCILKKGG